MAATIKSDLCGLIHFFRFVYWLQLHETFGPIVINMRRVINDIIALCCSLGIVCMAFSVGMMYMLDEKFLALQKGSNLTTTQKGNIYTDFKTFKVVLKFF